MPRKATDTVTEHRITLGDLERTQLKKMVQAEAIKDYGQAAQGIGMVAIGGGAVLGGAALVMFLAPQLWRNIKDLPKDIFNKFNSDLAELYTGNPILSDTVDWAAKGSPIEHRKQAQELARRRAELDNMIDYFCTASSIHYSEAVCTKLNTQSKRQYFDDLKAFNDMIDATYNETSPTHTFSMRAFIYKGLGDINPDNR